MDRTAEYKKLYKSGLSYQNIGKRFGITRQRVEQIINKDKYKIKRKTRISKLYDEFSNERKRIIYPLLEKLNKKEIQQILQKLVIYNQELRPIENYFSNRTKETGIKNGGKDMNRELVRKRDNHKCQLCGYRWRKGRKLDIHHIYDENGENTKKYDKDFNGIITLCHQCHLQIDKWKMELDKRNKNTLFTFKRKADLTKVKK